VTTRVLGKVKIVLYIGLGLDFFKNKNYLPTNNLKLEGW
jgi:hypothetical protein